MRKIYLPALAFLALASFTVQDPQDAAAKARQARELAEAAIEIAAMDYLDGLYDVKPRYVQRSVHPDAVRIGAGPDSADAPFPTAKMSRDQIVELAGSYNRDGHIPDEAPREVKILDVLDMTASARAKTAWGFDYLQLAKVEDEWLIVSILWQPFDHSTALPDADDVAMGAELFTSSRCTNCHGDDGTGSGRGPNLTDGEWVQSSGDLAGIAQTITNGVNADNMKGEYPRAMGAFGRRLQPPQVEALAQYVLSLKK